MISLTKSLSKRDQARFPRLTVVRGPRSKNNRFFGGRFQVERRSPNTMNKKLMRNFLTSEEGQKLDTKDFTQLLRRTHRR